MKTVKFFMLVFISGFFGFLSSCDTTLDARKSESKALKKYRQELQHSTSFDIDYLTESELKKLMYFDSVANAYGGKKMTGKRTKEDIEMSLSMSRDEVLDVIKGIVREQKRMRALGELTNELFPLIKKSSGEELDSLKKVYNYKKDSINRHYSE
jgi:hypothetical protein